MEEIVMTDEEYDFFVKFFMEGVNKPFVYKVDKETYDRIRRNYDEGVNTKYVKFDAFYNISVVTSIMYTCMIHFLWERKAIREDIESIPEVSIYFLGRNKADTIELDDPDMAFKLFDVFETFVDDDPYCSVVDVDGEEAMIDCRKVICMEIPQDLVKEGFKKIADELEEE